MVKNEHFRQLKQAMQQETYVHAAHSYEKHGPFLLYRLQGMLMSVWHMPSGTIAHIPLIWPQDEDGYNRQQRKFERAVRVWEAEHA